MLSSHLEKVKRGNDFLTPWRNNRRMQLLLQSTEVFAIWQCQRFHIMAERFLPLCHASVAQAQPPLRSSTERVKKMRDEQQNSGVVHDNSEIGKRLAALTSHFPNGSEKSCKRDEERRSVRH